VTSDTAANGVQLGTNIASDIRFVLGANNLIRVNDAAAYAAALDAATNAEALVTKGYVTNLVQTGAASSSVKVARATVNLGVDGVTAIPVANAVGGLVPAGATVLSVKVRVTVPNTTATLAIGDSQDNIVARYMTVDDNDPAANGLYMSEVFDTDAGTVGLIATVAGQTGGVGSAEVIVEYSVPA
jgi:hypothetical protein